MEETKVRCENKRLKAQLSQQQTRLEALREVAEAAKEYRKVIQESRGAWPTAAQFALIDCQEDILDKALRDAGME